MEHDEALKACALISGESDTVEEEIDNVLADLVVAASEVIGRVFLPTDQVLWMKQFLVSAISHLIHTGGLQIDLNRSWHEFPCLHPQLQI